VENLAVLENTALVEMCYFTGLLPSDWLSMLTQPIHTQTYLSMHTHTYSSELRRSCTLHKEGKVLFLVTVTNHTHNTTDTTPLSSDYSRKGNLNGMNHKYSARFLLAQMITMCACVPIKQPELRDSS